ncbi:uncharacterized protein DEA37_0000571 [Paragonimus westermani]|uniref:Laminin G domain-containing protein n=1 Tax=Paragonimus westermani TaxID=34504 RepID=A0A5J4P213_9TREM|nr:uncharacterized protein DEA37_0000571 [Paragonimus westermani]
MLYFLAVCSYACFCLPSTMAIMGSPPKNLPPCLNGGTQIVNEERYTCKCPLEVMDRQCKLTRVTVTDGPIEMKYGPFQITLNQTRYFHLSLQYITKDKKGDGTLLVVKDSAGDPQIHILLSSGRPGTILSLGTVKKTMQFTAITPATNDNAWHYVDLFLEASAQKQLMIYLLFDRCRDLTVDQCELKQIVDSAPLAYDIGGSVQLGITAGAAQQSLDSCVDKVIFDGELLDFYRATWQQPSKRGCPDAEQGCVKNGQKVCGTFGLCQNALSETDMLTCLCRPGYAPDATKDPLPHRWPCNTAAEAWTTTSTEYNAKFRDLVPARFRLSLRTRDINFTVFVVASWRLQLTVTNGIPKLQFRDVIIEMKNLNVSDGNWHLYEITFTPSFLELYIDGLDKSFYGAKHFGFSIIPKGEADLVVAKDAYEVLIILIILCCCRRKKSRQTTIQVKEATLGDEQLGVESQVNDPWDSVKAKPPSLETADFNPRDHGQKTSAIPPWERFEGQDNPVMNLDQALEYGYEGFDGKPPPEFCPDEPSSLVDEDVEPVESVPGLKYQPSNAYGGSVLYPGRRS